MFVVAVVVVVVNDDDDIVIIPLLRHLSELLVSTTPPFDRSSETPS